MNVVHAVEAVAADGRTGATSERVLIADCGEIKANSAIPWAPQCD
jgi:hypothetical protein